MPWSRIEGRKLRLGMGREKWGQRVEVERMRRVKKAERMRAMGYEFEGIGLTGVEAVPVRTVVKKAPIEATKEIEQEGTSLTAPRNNGRDDSP